MRQDQEDAEALVDRLSQQVRDLESELEASQRRLAQADHAHERAAETHATNTKALSDRVASLESQLDASRAELEEMTAYKEQQAQVQHKAAASCEQLVIEPALPHQFPAILVQFR